MKYILRIWKGDSSGNPPVHTEDIFGEPSEVGVKAEERVVELGYDPDKDDYTLAEHEVPNPGRSRL